ncbi:MAG: transposase zinc-binding domain-containing protein [Bacteroidales bacterium]
MSRQQYEVADVIKLFGQRFCEEYQPNEYQKRILNALSLCRTIALGGHKEKCDCCAKERISYNSCRNRHCPKCQASRQVFWVEDLLETTLQVKHYHIVFTVPHELPSRFVKIRRYGIYNHTAKRYLGLLFVPEEKPDLDALINNQNPPETGLQRFERLTDVNPCKCPMCKTGRMVVIRELPRIRAPDCIFPVQFPALYY